MNLWNDKPYHSLDFELKKRFHEKVYRLALNGGMTCPNRDGHIATGGCIFCSQGGSGDFAAPASLSISKQIRAGQKLLANKRPVHKYIAYFQAYTNTYAPVEELKRKYEEALAQENVVALSIATRPDCLDDDVLDFLEELNKKTYLWVELGLQTINDETANNFNRGYDFEVFDRSIKKLQERGIEVVVHTIFGLPGESKEDMLKTINYVAHSGAQGIKFHLLHLMKNTKMAEQYEREEFELLSKEDYIDLICKGVAMIPEEMVVHRLTGDAPRASLIGPMWSLKKWEVLNDIDRALVENDIWQGKDFK